MDIVATWHPQTDPSGSTVNMTKTTGKFVFINESSVNMLVTLSNGFKFYLGSSDRRMVCLTTVAATFQWVNVGATSPPGFDNAFVEHYQPGEPMFETYPSPLMRQVNVGNSVNTVAGTAQYLIDDNDPASHQFIESTVFGSPSSAILVLNDGTVTIKGDVAHVLTTLLQLIPGAASGAASVILADSSRIVEVLGNIQVDGSIVGKAAQNLNISAASAQEVHLQVNGVDIAIVDSTGLFFDSVFSKVSGGVDGVIAVTGTGATQNTRLQSGALINLQVPGGTSQAVVDNTGFTVSPGQLHLVVGDLRHINGNSSAMTANTAISHGLGIAPRLVLITPNVNNGNGSGTVGAGNFTSTTFNCTIGAGSSGSWFAIKE